ncbi:MAG: tetratricopeptide repeat protein [Pirellulales bacterium]|nr:tetratricopeptide repeat protein [Pirellulales bacterium]
MTTVSEALAQGVQHHQAGRLREAEWMYRQVLRVDPTHPDPLHLMGLIAHQIGKHEKAVELIGQAIEQRPDVPEFHESLAAACLAAGQPEEAERHAREALKSNEDSAQTRLTLAGALREQGKIVEAQQEYSTVLRQAPELAEAHNGLGMVLRAQGEFEDAVAAYRKAVELQPDYAEAHNNLANGLRSIGLLEEALTSYRRAIELDPENAELSLNEGMALAEAERVDEALEAYRCALEKNPDLVNARKNVAIILRGRGLLDESLAELTKALAVEPESAELHYYVGTVCHRQGRFAEAEAAYRESLRIAPDRSDANNNLGNALASLERYDEAEVSYRRAIELEPDYHMTHGNLANIYKVREEWDDVRRCYQQVRRIRVTEPFWELRIAALCPTVFDSTEQIDRYHESFLAEIRRFKELDCEATWQEVVTCAGEPPFNLQFDRTNLRPIKDAYADAISRFFPEEEARLGKGRPRIGFVVTRLHERVFLRSLRAIVERMDPKRFESVVVCDYSVQELIRRELPFEHVGILAIAEPIEVMVEAIREARFDVLYYREVGTDAPNYFLPFFRLAPVQCTSFGIQVTSGIPNMDYYMSSTLVESEGAQAHYRERLLLADTLLPYRRPVTWPEPLRGRDEFGFSHREHLYVCAHQLGKCHPDFDAVMASILRRDPAGRIVFTSDRWGYIAEKLKARFARTIPDVAGRITFLPFLGRPDYLSLMAMADVLLDPLYFGGMNTSYDGLAMERPIVTLPSAYHRGRYALGCYRKIGYTECVASDVEDYIAKAVSFATDADRRHEACREIARRKHLLFEDERSISEHERLFQEMIDRAA